MNKETFQQEYLWLKNVIKNLEIEKFIYLSSQVFITIKMLLSEV